MAVSDEDAEFIHDKLDRLIDKQHIINIYILVFGTICVLIIIIKN